MKLYFKRGVVGGFIITILTIGGPGIYTNISIRKLIEESYVIGGNPAFLKPYNNKESNR